MSTNLSDLIAALSDGDVAKQAEAAEQLAQLGAEAQPAAVALVRACSNEDEEVREWITAALEEIGPPNAAIIDS
jgi:HEAT repeat protein